MDGLWHADLCWAENLGHHLMMSCAHVDRWPLRVLPMHSFGWGCRFFFFSLIDWRRYICALALSRAAISIRHYISYVCRWCNSSFVYRYDADAHHNNNNNSLLPIYLSTLHREASPTAIALAMAILANLASTDMMVNRARSLSPNHQKLPRPIQKARSCLLQNHHLNQVLTSKDPFWQRSTIRPVVLIGIEMRVGWEKKMSATGMGLLVMTHHWLKPLTWMRTDSSAILLLS